VQARKAEIPVRCNRVHADFTLRDQNLNGDYLLINSIKSVTLGSLRTAEGRKSGSIA
jgi:hypothetical protein